MKTDSRALIRCALSGLLCAPSALIAAGCGELEPSNDDQHVESQAGEAAETDLAIGAHGSAVSALQGYLNDYGYFPSAALAERYPEWRPITKAAPRPGAYDEATEAAVRELQRRNGIEPTGVVGSETRQLIATARCGNPDSSEHESHDKFALNPSKWPANKRNLSWKVIDPAKCVRLNGVKADGKGNWISCFGTPPPITLTQLRAAASAALGAWDMETDLIFTEKTDQTASTDITFKFVEVYQTGPGTPPRPSDEKGLESSPSTLGATVVTSSGSTIVNAVVHFDQSKPFSAAPSTPANRFDLLGITSHEVGHALGLSHSNVGTRPLMQPFFDPGPGEPRVPRPDDAVAVSVNYDIWNTRPGLARDLAVGSDGSVWSIGTPSASGGFRIYRWAPPTLGSAGMWVEASGDKGAVRIGVLANGTPWVLDNANALYWHAADPSQGGWERLPNICAKDIGVGADNSVWFVTCTPDTSGAGGGFRVGKLVMVAVDLNTVLFGVQEGAGEAHALRITVGPDGVPWIVNAQNRVQMRRSGDPAVAGFSNRGDVTASDITITPTEDGTPYVTGIGAVSGVGVYVWNDQAASTGVLKRNGWLALATLPLGTPAAIAAGPRTVWVANSSGVIYENTAPPLF
jgi:peptidoglycan hydrolase-like protein with peptidoglycan-binding domain